MLRLTDLAVSHGGRAALAPLSLEVPSGRLVAVTGPSGSGKTSLLLAIAGRIPARGEVTLDGRPLRPSDVALVPQGNHLARVLTALENIALPLAATGGADPVGLADAALHTVGLGESGNHLVEELSGGQQQRVAVARALARSADVLLADDCTSDLDGANREKVLAALRAEARRGAHVLCATNDLDAADECDEHLALDEGVVSRVR
ncbi:ABC transporter ATP-binding protein [Nocardioides sambongensis]|uniref:ABC transporter ATP-binding protein n=1 Tax=Nocardioides sambongensis TaxID=2589074 RepID=UPI00112B2A1F|nr:ATP-binding cassette domain-containing protein [Nocardioides sambongensis]